MADATEHAVGLRELRHQTSAVMSRVRRGETIDVTDRGRLVARIVPAPDQRPGPVLQRLADEGRLIPAARPGHRPRMLAGDGTSRVSDALSQLRADDR